MTQDQALDVLKTGSNVFLTGEPGSGKTFVINAYIAYLEACKVPVAVTASTGIAATHIGGMTIHSWSGIGARDALSAYELDQIVSREKVAKRIQKARVLIIDEISMLDGTYLDMVHKVCAQVRQSAEAFGGLQVVFVGDFFQLPPVTRQGNVMRYAFESYAYDRAKPLVCYITQQYRQDDELFVGLLNSIRKGQIEEEHFTLLQEQTEIAYEHIEPTRLYTHNADVDAVNAAKLAALPGVVHTFKMDGRGNKLAQQALAKQCLSPETLQLKEDAMVMCTKNNFEAGYVNGTLGRVVAFDPQDGYPVIETSEGKKITVKPTSWEMSEDGKVLAEVSQVPLRLAWAITVHKSQGMSLDAAEIDLSRAFVYGQGYVALSRVRTLGGLKMLGMSANALQVDPKIVVLDEKLRAESEIVDDTFLQMDESETEKLHRQFVEHCGGTYVTGEVEPRQKGYQRVQKESTFVATHDLLRKKRSVAHIAKERNLAQSTVWSHIEKLVADKLVRFDDIAHLLQGDNWHTTYEEVRSAIREVGEEKLKPLYEYCGEKYTYDEIRLARLQYLLSIGGET